MLPSLLFSQKVEKSSSEARKEGLAPVGFFLFLKDGFQPFQAAFFRGSGDFYFVDPDFEWAYIVTHEPELGPYFVTKAT